MAARRMIRREFLHDTAAALVAAPLLPVPVSEPEPPRWRPERLSPTLQQALAHQLNIHCDESCRGWITTEACLARCRHDLRRVWFDRLGPGLAALAGMGPADETLYLTPAARSPGVRYTFDSVASSRRTVDRDVQRSWSRWPAQDAASPYSFGGQIASSLQSLLIWAEQTQPPILGAVDLQIESRGFLLEFYLWATYGRPDPDLPALPRTES